MRSRIVKIGNSQGVRIPKPLIEEAGLAEEVEISVRTDCIVIAPARTAREGWAETFRRMAQRTDDFLVDGDQIESSSWDEEEWEWQ